MSAFFPETGSSRAEILAALSDAKGQDLPSDGHAFALIYDAGQEARALAAEAYASCMSINGLDPTVFPSARRLENALVGAALEITRAPAGAVGTATTGGTESVMLAVKAARDHARLTRPEVTAPKMLLPRTAHACFHKAAHYLGLEVVPVEVDPITMKASAADARAKMSREVILVVGSAPSYTHGVIDPIAELAALALEHGTAMHVDACVGGWVLPFLRESELQAAEAERARSPRSGRSQLSVADFDFTVPGVTSLSLDLHKFGYAPKGISIVLHRRPELREAQYFACASWTGYSMINPTALGSRSVAAMGAAFALLRMFGKRGFRERAVSMWRATERLVAAIDRTPALRTVGRPEMNLLAVTTRGGDLFELADRLVERGWHVQPTYAFGPSPAHIHLTIDPSNAERIDDFARDLAACASDLPPAESPPEAVLSMLGQLGQGGGPSPKDLMAALGIKDGRLPARAGMIHRLIDAAPPPAREMLLKLFVGELFSCPTE